MLDATLDLQNFLDSSFQVEIEIEMCRSGFTNPTNTRVWEVVELINTPQQEGPSSYRRDRRQPKDKQKVKSDEMSSWSGCAKRSSTKAVLVGELRHSSPNVVKCPWGLLVAQANEGGGGGNGTPRHAKPRDDLSLLLISHSNFRIFLILEASRTSWYEGRSRVGRYGLTLLHWEEDGSIDRTTVAIAM